MVVNVKQLVAPAQSVVNEQFESQRNATRMQGFLKGLAGIASAKRKQGQVDLIKEQLDRQGIDITDALMNKKLTALEKLGLQQQANKIKMLGAGLDYTNVDEFPKTYGTLFDKQPDVLKLANDLKRAEIMAAAQRARDDRFLFSPMTPGGGGAGSGMSSLGGFFQGVGNLFSSDEDQWFNNQLGDN